VLLLILPSMSKRRARTLVGLVILTCFLGSPLQGQALRCRPGLVSATVIKDTAAHKAPLENAPVVEMVESGATTVVLTRTRDWALVRLVSGRPAWVKQATLKEQPESAIVQNCPASPPLETRGPREQVTITRRALGRTSANQSASPIIIRSPGETGFIVARAPGWALVRSAAGPEAWFEESDLSLMKEQLVRE
jgi:hypothetical protein